MSGERNKLGKAKTVKKRRNRTSSEEEYHAAPGGLAGRQPAPSPPGVEEAVPQLRDLTPAPFSQRGTLESSPHWKQVKGDACKVLFGGPAPSFTYHFNFIKLQLAISFMGGFSSVALLSVRTTAVTFFRMKSKTHKAKSWFASRPILSSVERVEDT